MQTLYANMDVQSELQYVQYIRNRQLSMWNVIQEHYDIPASFRNEVYKWIYDGTFHEKAQGKRTTIVVKEHSVPHDDTTTFHHCL